MLRLLFSHDLMVKAFWCFVDFFFVYLCGGVAVVFVVCVFFNAMKFSL